MRINVGNREFTFSFVLLNQVDVQARNRVEKRDVTICRMVEVRQNEIVNVAESQTVRRPDEVPNKELGRYYALMRLLPAFKLNPTQVDEFMGIYEAYRMKVNRNFFKLIDKGSVKISDAPSVENSQPE